MRNLPLCLALALGCSTPSSLPPPRPAPPPPAPPPAPWSRFAEVTALPALGESFPNLGHPGAGAVARVHVSAAARPGYETLVRDSALPEGALIAAFHGDREGHAAGPVYVMEKRGGAWSYVELTARGVIVESDTTRCAGCHAGAVGDSLFGLPQRAETPKP